MKESIHKNKSLRHFLHLILQYWRGPEKYTAYVLGGGFFVSLIVNLSMALLINRWSKDFFDALQQHRMSAIIESIEQLTLLACGTALAAIVTVQFRMRLQLTWRLWMMSHLVDHWIVSGISRDRLMVFFIDNPEARIADDGRIAIELFVEMVGGLVYTILISTSFIIVLWNIGGDFFVFGFQIHGFLVYCVIFYTGLTSLGMLALCIPLVKTVEDKAAAEGNFRYFLTENVQSVHPIEGENDDRSNGLEKFFEALLIKWLHVIHGQTKIISFATTNNLIAPVIPVVLCAPKYLSGEMSLGDIMQTAAAFLQVQTSLNWLADNAFSIANWSASARRVAALDATIHSHLIE